MKFTRTSASVLVILLVVAAIPAPTVAAAGTQQGDCGFPVTRTDATGTQVTIENKPDRIVTLNPSAAQTLWELGLQDKVVGISEYATYLDGAKNKTLVNTRSSGIIVEKVIAQRPDIVFAPGTIPNETVENLRSKGITVFAMNTPKSIDGVAEKTTLIGRLTGACTAAEETNDWMRTNVERVRSAVSDQPSPRAMYVFYGYTVGAKTFIHDMMTAAGTTNIMAKAGVTGYAKVNKEIVRERNPQWIIVNSGDPGIPADPAFNETIAVQQNQTVTVNINYMNQPAPRSVVMAVRKMASEIHPDAMSGVELAPRDQFEITTTTTTTTTTTATATEQPTTTTTTTTESQTPGFTAAAGIVALLAAALLARR